MRKFDYSLNYKALNLRERPDLYAIGRGEQGVLLVEPYKSELLPDWRFRTPEIARASSAALYAKFLEYLAAEDFVGADMARKFLQMGYTRSRRYANYRSGKKYDGPVPDDKKGQSGAHGRDQLPRQDEDPEKAESARIFKAAYEEAKAHPDYKKQKAAFLERYG
ncbi:DUF4385 domain-containing protein [Lewinella sp. IMCC34183]|uniref:DUF4385 domain-containing protein n=1 Tax=Lewinella sp. IMCC34183 TaxID=2248762 RepID=UPI000E27345B|nr:DUF4385 domain-containing protein [Lewinella sp. IMCC34183]